MLDAILKFGPNTAKIAEFIKTKNSSLVMERINKLKEKNVSELSSEEQECIQKLHGGVT